MSEARFASLSSGLLARKGAAKPAMRPQGFGQLGASLEDLGWNDMGTPAQPFEDRVPSSIAALTPAPRVAEDGPPAVVAQQRAIAASFDPVEEADEIDEAPVAAAKEPDSIVADVVVADLPARPVAAVVPLPRQPRAPVAVAAPGKSRAAFTLRLDAERHLRLRLASAVAGRSSQQIVTAALDAYLAAQPELDGLAAQLPAAARGH